MNGQKVVLIATAIVALGIFVMPSTVSLFSGQHYWYNISDGGNEVPCEKCHADIAAEMNVLVGPHTNETGYGRFKCDYCHRTFDLNDYGQEQSQNINQSIFSRYYYTYASGDGTGAQPGVEAHAASTVPCMYCHSGEDVGGRGTHGGFTSNCCLCHHDGDDDHYYHGNRFYDGGTSTEKCECIKCHPVIGDDVLYVPPAGGFNLTANSTDTGRIAAHKSFVMASISNPDMEDANEACIACHTGIPVQINWTHAANLVLNATYIPSKKVPPTHFKAHDFSENGTVLVISYGNWSGGAKNGSWPSGDIDIWGYNKAP